MIIAIVQIPVDGPKRPRDDVVALSVKSAGDIFHDVKGLQRKYYLNGDAGGGGVYVFDSREDADAWFNEDWADWMEGRFGARPTLTIYDSHVVVDNVANEVRVDGKPIPAPWADKGN